MDALQTTVQGRLPEFAAAAVALRDVLLANLVMIGEVAAPTGEEQARVQLLAERLGACGYSDCSIDEVGSVSARLPGTEGERTILLVTNADSLAERHEEPFIALSEDRAIGPFFGDNSLALAFLISLPALLERLTLRLRSHVVVLGAAQMLERSNQLGLHHFLEGAAAGVQQALVLETVQLGRLNHTCLGRFLADVTVRVPDDYDWGRYGATGAIVPLTDVIGRLAGIALPRRPSAQIVFGRVRGGFTHRSIAREATVGLEVRSESAALLDDVAQQIRDIVEEVHARSGVQVTFNEFSRRAPGQLPIGHPLVQTVRAIHTAMGIETSLYATTGWLSALLEKGIPAVTLGLTTGHLGKESREIDETIDLPPLWQGAAQVLATLVAMDGGLCDG